MLWAFERLGIAPDAEERAIKRAYAQQLKTTRPDEDPEGFQRLREAYEAALEAHARRQHEAWRERMEAAEAETSSDAANAGDTAVHADQWQVSSVPAAADATEGDGTRDAREAIPGAATDHADAAPHTAEPYREEPRGAERDGPEGEGPGPDTTEQDGTEPAPEAPQVVNIDMGQLFDACTYAARHGDPRPLNAWLQEEPLLWSLQHKPIIGRWLLQMLDEHTPPIPSRNFDTVAECFGWSDLHAGFDPMALGALRTRLDDAWRDQIPNRMRTDTRARHDAQRDAEDARTAHDRIEREQRELRERHRRLDEGARLAHPHLRGARGPLNQLRLMLIPGYAAGVAVFLAAFGAGKRSTLPEGFSRTRTEFWALAGDDRRWSLPRTRLAMTRCTVLAALYALVERMFTALHGQGWGRFDDFTETFWRVLPMAAAAWLMVAIIKSLQQWQAGPEPAAPFPKTALHVAALPLLSACIWLFAECGWNALAFMSAAVLVSVADTRLRAHRPQLAQRVLPPASRGPVEALLRWGMRVFVPLMFVSAVVGFEIFKPLMLGAATALAMLMWAVDVLSPRRAA